MTLHALIDFAAPRHPGAPRLRHAFGAPRAVHVAHRLPDVRGVLQAAEAAAHAGAWCVGALRYEAAPAFDAALPTHSADGPLAWFAEFDAPQPWPEVFGPPAHVDWRASLARPAFDAAHAAIHRAIARGDCYQVNYTAPLHGPLHGTPLALFAALQRAQPGGYAAYIDMGAEQLLSVSPELFFDWRGGHILTRPMKGTAPRGATPVQDAAHAAALRASPKERAENVMIVDLLRNDLSRIAQPHSVQVPPAALFATQALPAVWQMTSDVEARTRAGVGLADVLAALFPCGSVTGAPKRQAMRMIAALEPAPRGFYCGAIGVLQPGGAATFNVPIRTVSVRAGQAQCGIGSGITWDARADAEWAEWQHKAAFLHKANDDGL